VAQFLGGPNSASVEVLNGAGVSGLAARPADRLAQAGFVIVSIGDAPRAQSQTNIIARPTARSAAEQVASTLGISTARVSVNASLSAADVQVVLGADAR
ncbi:MAG TPA: LytR C-terminal domain-containing protein, partial [Chloroflexota bacterium]